MAKKQTVSKTQAVKDYLKSRPDAMSGEIAAALNKKGVKINAGHVANIKTKINKERKSMKAAKEEAAVESAPAPLAKANGTITLEQIKRVAQTVKAMGGYQKMTEVLEIIKEAGGVKKFNDLAQAMIVPETDAIPY